MEINDDFMTAASFFAAAVMVTVTVTVTVTSMA